MRKMVNDTLCELVDKSSEIKTYDDIIDFLAKKHQEENFQNFFITFWCVMKINNYKSE